MDTNNLRNFLSDNLKDTELSIKLNEMMTYILNSVMSDLNDTKYKQTNPELLGDAVIKETIKELGFNYIAGVMDTISGFQFNTMLSFVELISELKGTRKGLELVLKLMGFDSIIKEWWQDTLIDQQPWTYEIIIVVNTSIVPDLFATLAKVKIFSQNYVIAKVTNIDVRFSAENFAIISPLMGGFVTSTYRGRILDRAIP